MPTSRPGPLPAPTTSITLETRRVAGITVQVIRVNLGDPRVKLKVISPMAGIGRGGANFNTLVNGSNAVAVINGGYFHPRTFSIAGDLVVNGKHISTGRLRSVFAITPDNRVAIRTHSSINAAAWRGYETALAGGPFVLQRGNVVVAPRREGYRDPSVWSKAPRSAVGVVNNRQFFFISTKARLNLFDLAKVMDALGAKDAIALDGGSSVGMAFRREVLIRPNRRIAYGLGVFVEPKPIKRTKL
jgi:exopolysaccharide biosynthesis protein